MQDNEDDSERAEHPARDDIEYHQVGSKATVYRKNALTPKRVIVLLLSLVVAASMLFIKHGRKNYGSKHDPLLDADFPRCTFDDLYDSFHPAKKHFKRYNHNPPQNDTCWNLEDEVLRVPAKSIHRHHLVRLGNGYRGAVYKAIVKLPEGRQCYAALKTDHCNTPTSGIRTKQTRHSCLEPHSFSLNKDSYMAGEYAGASMFYALRHMKEQNPNAYDGRGLLPTWGLVQHFGHPIWTDHKRSKLEGYPHPDGTIKGIIMPLADFEPLNSLSEENEKMLLKDAKSVAKALLSSVEGLQFVSDMRLSYGDLMEKNMGLIVDPETKELQTIVFDNSYVSVRDRDQCSLPEDQNEGCNFCEDKIMFRDENGDGAKRDFGAVVGVVVRMLNRSEGVSDEKNAFIAKVKACMSIHDLVKVLRSGP